MHVPVSLGLLALGICLPLAAQTAAPPVSVVSCPGVSLTSTATQAATVRSQLRREAVTADDPAISPHLASLLLQFKDALAGTAAAVFTCAQSAATTEQVQNTLAESLHANRTAASETAFETRGKRDIGTYGSDLSVQVFQLFGKPKIFEVDFRYGIECGDDHLLLVYEVPSENPGSTWRQTLRWDAPGYTSVGNALGDFVLLTPLTGSYQHPVWRYLVAHGEPGCGATPRPSQFTLDLLTPSSDPAKPAISWHFTDAYTQGNTVPRLATTEDTIEFRLTPAAASDSGAPEQSGTSTKVPPATSPHSAASTEKVYRFHLNSNGVIVPDSAPSQKP